MTFAQTGRFKISADNKMIVRFTSIDKSSRPAKDLSLMIDTGAFITMLKKETAQMNGYPIIAQKGCIIAGFSEKGLICDLRIIRSAVFCGYIIKDVIIATPHENGIRVTEVLGMNVLENFDFGFSLTNKEIHLNKRGFFESVKPRYKSGQVDIASPDKS